MAVVLRFVRDVRSGKGSNTTDTTVSVAWYFSGGEIARQNNLCRATLDHVELGYKDQRA